MSWHDCHIGYTWWAIPICIFLPLPWLLVGIMASLNGGYAMAFTVRPSGCYSRPLWWLALFFSVVITILFTTLEFTFAQQGVIGIEDIAVVVLITKLALGNWRFYFESAAMDFS